MALNLRGGLLRNLIGIGVAVAIGLGWWGFNTFKEKASAPDVGECVTVSGTISNAEVEEAKCGADDVLYKVTADKGDCDPNEDTYTVTVQGSDAVKLCLFWEVEAGDCVKEGTTGSEKVDCASNKGSTVAKVVSVEDKANAKCASQEEYPIVNEKRDVTICVTPNL